MQELVAMTVGFVSGVIVMVTLEHVLGGEEDEGKEDNGDDDEEGHKLPLMYASDAARSGEAGDMVRTASGTSPAPMKRSYTGQALAIQEKQSRYVSDDTATGRSAAPKHNVSNHASGERGVLRVFRSSMQRPLHHASTINLSIDLLHSLICLRALTSRLDDVPKP